MSYQETLRKSVAEFAPHTNWVRVNEDRLVTYLSDVANRDLQVSHDPTLSDVGDAETRMAFVLMRDATNFGSGWHPHLKKRPGLSGARTTGAALADFFRKEGVPSMAWLQSVDATACAEIFGQTLDPPVSELMERFAQAWHQLGDVVARDYDGRFCNLVEAAHGSALRLSEMLSSIGYFHDIYHYHGLSFPFLKRAQLACYDLSLSLAGDPRSEFGDLDQLTIFVDNLVPHVLKVDGMLTFDQDLDERIEAGILIPSGSPEEIEIRAMAVYAVERLSALADEKGDPVIPLRISDWLWNRGQGPKYKARPRHRTHSVHY